MLNRSSISKLIRVSSKRAKIRNTAQARAAQETLEWRILMSVTEFPIPDALTPRPEGITRGPDGNLWFAENTSSRIGRITPAGVITEFSAGITPNSGPGAITRGPDGNLWFTEILANKIGRITPAGVVTEFSAGITPGTTPNFITAGPDGNVWFK